MADGGRRREEEREKHAQEEAESEEYPFCRRGLEIGQLSARLGRRGSPHPSGN
jgi:hypothetical protein